KGKAAKQRIGPLFLTGGQMDLCLQKQMLISSTRWLVTMEIFYSTFVILKITNISLKGIVGILVSQRLQSAPLVNCLRDRSPTVATTTPPPPPPPPPPPAAPPSQQSEKSSVGSGFFVSKPMGSETSYVVTNFHVIDGCKSAIRVRYPIYQPVNAYVRAVDPANDLALLSTKLPASGFPSFRLNLKQGEQIASYGFPYRADFASFTMGNVTSVVGLDNNTSAFQMSAPVQPGNSGGPLLDMNGRVIGMAQGILGTLRAAEALGGAIPQNVNVGITATTIIGFLQAHSVDYRIDTERTKFEPEQIAEEAKKFSVKVTCGD